MRDMSLILEIDEFQIMCRLNNILLDSYKYWSIWERSAIELIV